MSGLSKRLRRARALTAALALGASAWASAAASADEAADRSGSHRDADEAQKRKPGSFFVEGQVGGAVGRFTDFGFLAPDAGRSGRATEPDAGFIRLHTTGGSFLGGFGAGAFIAPEIYAKLSYQYLGRFRASGLALFDAGIAAEALRADAHGVLVGFGYVHDVTDRLFLEATFEVGAGFVFARSAQQFAGGALSYAPSELNFGLAGSLGLGFGYRVGPGVDLLANVTYTSVGALGTAARGFPDPLALAPGTRLSGDLSTLGVRIGTRIALGEASSPSLVAQKSDNKAEGGSGGTDEKDEKGEDKVWSLHAQSTGVYQGTGRFRSPYEGPQSLPPNGEWRETVSNSIYVGRRLWEGGALYFNPDFFQGFGLGNTTGLGGFSNGEAQKSNFLYPHPNVSRLYLQQTFGFGGEQETVEDAANQLGGKRDVSRLTVTVGKFAVPDFFDNNDYAHDPRKDFFNWSVWEGGAFDYAADKKGFREGVVVDFNQKYWAVRAGYILMPKESNVDSADLHLFRRGEYVAELETRYNLFSQPGKLRVLGFLNSAFSGSYREALQFDDPNEGIVATRRTRIKYGFVVNAQQAITDNIGIFGRASWNNGQSEIMAFTDIDASLSGGLSLKGALWNRPDDTFGIAGVINELSAAQRDYTAAGGLGILIGDGRLNYGPEKILETYYALNLAKSTWLTFDYQYVDNPAYNRDRGPVSIYSFRLHWEH